MCVNVNVCECLRVCVSVRARAHARVYLHQSKLFAPVNTNALTEPSQTIYHGPITHP